jgi:hypothetical protein
LAWLEDEDEFVDIYITEKRHLHADDVTEMHKRRADASVREAEIGFKR